MPSVGGCTLPFPGSARPEMDARGLRGVEMGQKKMGSRARITPNKRAEIMAWIIGSQVYTL